MTKYNLDKTVISEKKRNWYKTYGLNQTELIAIFIIYKKKLRQHNYLITRKFSGGGGMGRKMY